MDADEVIRKIRDVEIQGATSVAEAGIELLQEMEADGRSDEEIQDVEERLQAVRPTEPLLDNAIAAAETDGYDDVLAHIEEAQDAITRNGTGLVDGVDTVYTHCHSSTVTGILEAAYQDTEFDVWVTETRPLFQGRSTARELVEAGIPVTLSVDGAAGQALSAADIMLIGADAILPDGTVINKIGSGVFAAAATQHDVPVYVAADSWKAGDAVDVEQRGADEVWEDAPAAVDIENPAFEHVPAQHITGIVSELGVHEPNEFMDAAHDTYPEVL